MPGDGEGDGDDTRPHHHPKELEQPRDVNVNGKDDESGWNEQDGDADDHDVFQDDAASVVLEVLLIADGSLHTHRHLAVWGDGLRCEGCYVGLEEGDHC